MYMLVCTVHHVHTLHLNLLLMEIPRVDEIHILLASMTISNCEKICSRQRPKFPRSCYLHFPAEC